MQTMKIISFDTVLVTRDPSDPLIDVITTIRPSAELAAHDEASALPAE
jgi:hypothetical protein